MVIGSILLQPQRLERAGQADAGDTMLSDVLDLSMRLMIDVRGRGQVAGKLGGSVEGTAARLVERAGAGADKAAKRFNAHFAPLLASIRAMAEQPPDELEEWIEGVEKGLTKAVGFLQNLTPEQIRGGVSAMFDALEKDLGMTPSFIRDLVLGFFDDMILALGSPPPEEAPDERANRRAIAGHLGRIKRFLAENFTFPALNADAAAQAILTLRQRPDVDAALTRALCSGKAALAWMRAGRELTDLIPYSALPPFGEGSLGAAAVPPPPEEYSFYATKLLEHDNYDGDLGPLLIELGDLEEGLLQPPLLEAFRSASVVLASSAFLYNITENEEWRVVDRKQYVIREESGSLWIYRLFEIKKKDFLKGDHQELLKVFRENGYPLRALTLVADPGETWFIPTSGQSFRATTFEEKTVVIRPATPSGALFVLEAGLQPADGDKADPGAALRIAFEQRGVPLSPLCRLSTREAGREWILDDGDFDYVIEKDDDKLVGKTGNCGGWLRAKISAIPGTPKGHAVWVNRERTQVLLDQRILHTGNDVSWFDAPIFKDGSRRYSLKADPKTIERCARHASWVQDLVNVLLYAIQTGGAIGRGDVEYSITSTGLESGRLISEIIVNCARRRPMARLVGLATRFGCWYDTLLFAIITGVKIAEASQKPEPPPIPPTTLGGDVGVEGILDTLVGVRLADPHWNGLLYEAFLSLLTLCNHEEPAAGSGQARPRNYEQSGGFVDLFVRGALLGYTAIIQSLLPLPKKGHAWGAWLGGSVGVGAFASLFGLACARGIAGRDILGGGHLVQTMGISAGKSVLYFFPYLRLLHGDVDLV